MAVGNVVSNLATLTAGQSLDVKPSTGQEWTIHNIYYNGGVSLKIVRGSDELTFDTDTSANSRSGLTFNVTENQFIRITNTSGTTILVGYDGKQTW